LQNMKEVRIHAVRHEALAEVVEVHAPRIRRAVSEILEDKPRGMNAIDAAVAMDPLVGRRAGATDVGGTGAAMPGVEPAVGAPRKPVGQVMPALLVAKAVEKHLRRTIGFVIAVAVGNEVETWGRHDPHAAEAVFDAGDIVEPLE